MTDSSRRTVSPARNVAREALQDLRSSSLDDFYRARGARDGYRPRVQDLQPRGRSRRRTARTRGPHIERAQRWQQDNPERYASDAARVRRQRQEGDLGSQESPEAEVRAHARAVRRDARGAGRRVRDLPRRGRTTARCTSTTTTRPARSAGCSASRCNNALGLTSATTPICSTPRPTISTATTSSIELSTSAARALGLTGAG